MKQNSRTRSTIGIFLFSLGVLCVCAEAQVEPYRTFTHPSPAQIYAAAISPDGSKVVTGCAGAKVWDVESGELLVTVHQRGNYVCSVAFSPDGQRLATGDWDGRAMIWDVKTGELLWSCDVDPEHSGTSDVGFVECVVFSPDGDRLLAGHANSSNPETKVFRIPSGDLVFEVGLCCPTMFAKFSPDGNRICITSGDQVQIWDLLTGALVRSFPGYAGVISADFSRIITCRSYGISSIYDLYDAKTGDIIRTFEFPLPPPGLAFFPIASLLVRGPRGRSTVMDMDTGDELGSFTYHGTRPLLQAFSSDARFLVTMGGDTAHVWDISDLVTAVENAELYDQKK